MRDAGTVTRWTQVETDDCDWVSLGRWAIVGMPWRSAAVSVESPHAVGTPPRSSVTAESAPGR